MSRLIRGDNKEFDEKATLDFLLMEFDKCFEQLRHYDSIQNSIIVLGITGYIGIYSALFSIYQGSLDSETKLWLTIFIVTLSFAVGLLLIISLIRNRGYFARTARQINSIRNYILNNSVLDFIRYNSHYTGGDYPHTLSYRSTSYIFLVFLCLTNASLIFSGDIVYLTLKFSITVFTALCIAIKWGVGVFILELIISTWLLQKND